MILVISHVTIFYLDLIYDSFSYVLSTCTLSYILRVYVQSAFSGGIWPLDLESKFIMYAKIHDGRIVSMAPHFEPGQKLLYNKPT
jgi:hypothetical protein